MNGQPENPRRAVLITGAASGIGAATARRFIQEGWLVAINYLDGTQRETARSLARTAAAPGQSAVALEGDRLATAVIVDAVRTPGGKRNGRLSGWHPADLAAAREVHLDMLRGRLPGASGPDSVVAMEVYRVRVPSSRAFVASLCSRSAP